MEKYLTYLKKDLLAAHRPVDFYDHYLPPQTFEEEMAEFEQLMDGEDHPRAKPFSDYCNVFAEQFPPVEKLSKSEITDLLHVLKLLFWSWGISLDTPLGLPIETLYPLAITVFNQKFFFTKDVMIGIEFCEHDLENCLYGKSYCTCLASEKEYEHKRKKMVRYVEQLLDDINQSLTNIPSTRTFNILYGYDPDVKGPLKSIGEWLGLDPAAFPSWVDLNNDELGSITNALRGLLNLEDEVINAIFHLELYKRYELLVKYLHTEVWYDGQGGFTFPPMTEEEFKSLKSPLDHPYFKDWLGDYSSDDIDYDEELPF
jgi:hypothetical protein